MAKLINQRRDLPRRVEIQDASQGAVIKLAGEQKHLSNIIKTVAYQAESELVSLFAGHCARADDEWRTLIHESFQSAADLDVHDNKYASRSTP